MTITHARKTPHNVRSPVLKNHFILDPDPFPDLDNLISIAESELSSIISDTQNARNARRIGAYCYILSMLLNVSSKKVIKTRKVQLQKVTSDLFELLEMHSAELISTATRTTVWPFLWCAFPMISGYKCKEAISAKLLRKLNELSSAVEEKFKRVLFHLVLTRFY